MPFRALIVDDEFVSRVKMKAILARHGECSMAESGAEALSMFREALAQGKPYHVVTLDVGMPTMNGVTVLGHLRQLEKEAGEQRGPRACVMMVTAHSERSTILGCLRAGCSGYIVKPFDVVTVDEKLTKAGVDFSGGGDDEEGTELSDNTGEPEEVPAGDLDPVQATASMEVPDGVPLVREVVAYLKGGHIQLPTWPDVAMQFDEKVRQDAEIFELGRVLERDMVISARLLSVANSAQYGGSEPCHNVTEALARLGIGTALRHVHAIAAQGLCLVRKSLCRGLLLRLWHHSLASAHGAKALVQVSQQWPSTDVFVLGLLHDMGKMVVFRIMDEFDRRGRLPFGTSESDVLAIASQLHCQFGRLLLRKWDFSACFQDVALYHDAPEAAPDSSVELDICHIASRIANDMGYSCVAYTADEEPELSWEELSQMPSVDRLGLDPGKVADAMDIVQEGMDSAKNLAQPE